MKLPRWNGIARPSEYVFSLVCFVAGYVVISICSLGRITYDDRDGPGWNPKTRMPDGRIGLSEFAIRTIGLVILCFVAVGLVGLALAWKNFRLR